MPASLLDLGRSLLALPEAESAALLANASPAELDEIEAAIAAVEAHERAQRWLRDPVGWALDVVDFGASNLHDYQADSLAELSRFHRLAVRSPHGVGKTATAALAVLWFATTRDAAGIPWKVPTTASVHRQLKHYLWPEIRSWAHRLRYDVLGRRPFTALELQQMRLRLAHGEAWAMASHDPAALEGAHAVHLLYVFDEAKAIPDAVWDAAEGAFAGAGADTSAEAWALAISTPGEPAGRFYNIARRDRRFSHWRARHVTLSDAVAAGRVSAQWAQTMAQQWTAGSAVYANRVLGEFAASPGDAVIPLPWVEAAIERWHERKEAMAGRPPTHAGLDVARTGDDRNVLIVLAEDFAGPPYRPPGGDSIAVATAVLPKIGTGPHGPLVLVDADGVGAGVYDQLATYRDVVPRLRPFMAGTRADWQDHTGLLSFGNLRAAAWWHVRDLLNPAWNPTLCLPDDDLLTGDLTAPKWRMVANDRILVESKDDIRKRIGRSTDTGDALVMACWGRVVGVLGVANPESHTGVAAITADLTGERAIGF